MKKAAMTGVSLALLFALGACGSGGDTDTNSSTTASTPTESSVAEQVETAVPATRLERLQTVVDGDWRPEDQKARDVFRNPAETLDFFEVDPDDTVLEVWPGGGWYTHILAPYLKDSGAYKVAEFDGSLAPFAQDVLDGFTAQFVDNPDLYGTIERATFSADSGPLFEADSVDMVLSFRNTHNWMGNGYADKAFADMFAVLKPGGTLGIVQHRLPSAEEQDPTASTGYVSEAYVKALAEQAGFEFVASSEINANPADDTDHPYGVWTLPPNSRTSDFQGNTVPDFDPAEYLPIGESDRMTLKFRKPTPE